MFLGSHFCFCKQTSETGNILATFIALRARCWVLGDLCLMMIEFLQIVFDHFYLVSKDPRPSLCKQR